MWANFTKVYILGTALKVRKRTKISSSLVYVLLQKSVMHVQTLLVFQNNETAAMLVYQDNPVGIELFYYVKTFYCPHKLA